MSYILGKRMTSYPPRPGGEVNAAKPFFSLAAGSNTLATVGSTLTAWYSGTPIGATGSTGWQWYKGGNPISNATNKSYALTAGEGGSYVSVRLLLGNATWGTGYIEAAYPGTVVP